MFRLRLIPFALHFVLGAALLFLGSEARGQQKGSSKPANNPIPPATISIPASGSPADAKKAAPYFAADTTKSKAVKAPEPDGLLGKKQAAVVPADSSKPKAAVKKVFAPSPKRAALLAAIVPGLGQIYNRRYWKLPILYGGIGTLAYFIKFNNDAYFAYRKAFITQNNAISDPNFPVAYTLKNSAFSTAALAQQRDYWRRNRDLLLIVSGFVYMLQIADATVDAHLMNFNVKDDITLTVAPSVEFINAQASAGVSFTFNLK